MLRIVVGVVLLSTVWAGPSLAAAPPGRGEIVRFISRAEIFSSVMQRPSTSSTSLERQRNLNQTLLNVEVAYWNLYGAFWMLHSREQGLRLADSMVRRSGTNSEVQDQSELFRRHRQHAVAIVEKKEQELRKLLGLPASDGTILVPSDAPEMVLHQPDWNKACTEALSLRPELLMARREVKMDQWLYRIVKALEEIPAVQTGVKKLVEELGFPTRAAFDQAPPTSFAGLPPRSAWGSAPVVEHDPFRSFRRRTQLRLARSMETLKDQELKAQRFLGRYSEQISVSYEDIRANLAQREAFGEVLRLRQEGYEAGQERLDLVLEAQRFWVDALGSEMSSIVTYNNNLTEFQYLKGTIRQHANSIIARANLWSEEAEPRGTREQRPTETPLIGFDRSLVVPSLPELWKSIPPLRPGSPLLQSKEGPRSEDQRR